jgi:formylmethanofuran dehydrogenase subunit B
VGRVSATLGEVKDRADVVVFWGVDPLVTQPRHWQRYSVEPRGRFVPGGRAGRTVIVVDCEPSATSAKADLFLPLAKDAEFEVLWTLRALVAGVALDPASVERSTGMSLATAQGLAQRLLGARYGAWFHGPELGQGRGGSARVEAALGLVRDLNARTRFVILSLGAAGNTAGAEAVLTWQAGAPRSVDFGGDFPRAPLEGSAAVAQLERGAADAALIVADADLEWLPASARKHLAQIPRILIAPQATAASDAPAAEVALAAATPGIDAPGTVTRVDGVVLPLRPPLAATVPTDRQWLCALRKRLE